MLIERGTGARPADRTQAERRREEADAAVLDERESGEPASAPPRDAGHALHDRSRSTGIWYCTFWIVFADSPRAALDGQRRDARARDRPGRHERAPRDGREPLRSTAPDVTSRMIWSRRRPRSSPRPDVRGLRRYASRLATARPRTVSARSAPGAPEKRRSRPGVAAPARERTNGSPALGDPNRFGARQALIALAA